MRILSEYLSQLVVLVVCVAVCGDVSASGAEDQGWVQYTTEDGLIDNHVTAFAFDHHGYTWIGTVAGLSRFDGDTFTTYTKDDGLPSNYVTSATVATDGSVWVGTMGGISRFDGESWTNFSVDDGLMSSAVLGVEAAYDGKVWYSSRGVAGYYDGSVWTNYQFDVELENPNPYRNTGYNFNGRATRKDRIIVCSPNGDVWKWIAGIGLVVYDGSDWRLVEVPEDSSEFGTFVGLDVAPDGTVWIAFRNRILSFKNGEWSIGIAIDSEDVRSIATGPEGQVWANSGWGEMICYNGVTWENVGSGKQQWSDVMSVSPEGAFYTMAGIYGAPMECVEKREGFWIYDDHSGTANMDTLEIADRVEFPVTISTEMNINNVRNIDGSSHDSPDGTWTTYDLGKVYNIYQDGSSIWCVTSRGLGRFDVETSSYTTVAGIVGDIAVTPDGNVWIGGRQQLYLYDGCEWHGNIFPEIQWGDFIIIGDVELHLTHYYDSIIPRSDSSLYMITALNALRYKNGQWSLMTNQRIIMSEPLMCSWNRPSEVVIDNNDIIWSWFDKKLYAYVDNNCIEHTVPKHIVSRLHEYALLYYIEYTTRDTIWLGSTVEYPCAIEYDGLNWTYYSAEEYESEYYRAMARDGVFWKGDDDGLHRLDLLPTAVDTDEDEPAAFALLPNTPNPFNPSTAVRFVLPQADHVRLDVYSITGQKVDTLLDGPLDAGTHVVEWDGSDCSAGVYFCRLTSGGAIRTGKMLLLK